MSVSLASHLRFSDFCFEAPPLHLRCINFCWMLRASASLAAVFTRSLLLEARLSLHALSSQARHWLEVRTIVFWTLTISSMKCNLSNLLDSCDFWKLLQHRVSSTTGHQRPRRMAQFSAPLHLWRLSLHHDSTLFCCGGFCQSCGEIRLHHLEQSNDSCALPSSPL